MRTLHGSRTALEILEGDAVFQRRRRKFRRARNNSSKLDRFSCRDRLLANTLKGDKGGHPGDDQVVQVTETVSAGSSIG